MVANFKFCKVPGSIVMGITFYVTILDIKCSFVGMYIDQGSSLYKDLMLFPVDYILDIDSRNVMIQINKLCDRGIQIFTLYFYAGSSGPFSTTSIADT